MIVFDQKKCFLANLKNLFKKYFILSVGTQTGAKAITIKHTSHILQARENTNYRRNFMFYNQEQYTKMFSVAFRDYGLYDYLNEGKVAIYFNYQGFMYAILVSLEQELEDKHATLNLITIDKIDTRHYTKHSLFGKEKFKIYMKDFELSKTYLGAAEVLLSEYKMPIKITEDRKYKKMSIVLLCANFHKNKKATMDFINSTQLGTKVIKKLLNSYSIYFESDEAIYTNTFWGKVNINGIVMFLNFAYEKCTKDVRTIIIIDIKPDSYSIEKRENQIILKDTITLNTKSTLRIVQKKVKTNTI